MTDTSPPVPGQIDGPNPLELFWERNRKTLTFVMFAIVAAIGAYYTIRYFQKQARNETWSSVATVTGLDVGYSSDGSLKSLLDNVSGQGGDEAQQERTRLMYLQYYLGETSRGLSGKLPEHVKGKSPAEFDAAISKHAGSKAEPLLVWFAASNALLNDDFERAEAKLSDLEARFGDHFLCQKSDYPPQYRLAIPKARERKLKAAEDDEKKDDDDPEFVDATSGSPVSQLRAAIAAQKKFRAEHPELYKAPEITEGPVVTLGFKIGDQEERFVKIRLFADKAPKHVENFLAKVKPGEEDAPSFYTGIRVHQIEKDGGSGESSAERPAQFSFGKPATKGEDDMTKWDIAPPVTDETEDKDLEFEDTSISLFPGMLSAQPATDGKSSSEEVWINFEDAAANHDGDRVVFGQVIEGMDLIEEIANYTLSSDAEEQSGQGKPRDFIEISSTKVD